MQTTQIDDRLTTLELTVLDLCKTVDDLNAELIHQTRQVERLTALCLALKKVAGDHLVKPLSEETPPPHY